MATQSSHGRYTWEKFRALPDDGRRYELVDGELYEMPSPTGTHQIIAFNCALLFDAAISMPAEGIVILDIDVRFSRHRAARPDLVLLSPGRRDRYKETHIAGAPDLILEVLSPSNEAHDRVRKLGWYDRYGVQEYWIAHQDRIRLEILRRGEDGHLGWPVALGPGDRLATPLLPRLDARVDQLFDRLPSPLGQDVPD
ncbi:MAG: Uma2 family endonuclease [Candidatus Sericytochromatia bacterium]|nr:Uma2 family endonuclease [Candidatus Tanganyikabacteria bacterium]